MPGYISDISERTAARVAGIGYLIIFILAIFSNFFVLNSLIVHEDAAATVSNIITSQGLFRIGISSFIVVSILDVVVAMALYKLFKSVNRSISLLAAWFRLMHSIIFGIALVNLILVINILNSSHNPVLSMTNELQMQIMIFLDTFNFGWLIGLVFFGLHLFLLAYLTFRSDFVPKILGFY